MLGRKRWLTLTEVHLHLVLCVGVTGIKQVLFCPVFFFRVCAFLAVCTPRAKKKKGQNDLMPRISHQKILQVIRHQKTTLHLSGAHLSDITSLRLCSVTVLPYPWLKDVEHNLAAAFRQGCRGALCVSTWLFLRPRVLSSSFLLLCHHIPSFLKLLLVFSAFENWVTVFFLMIVLSASEPLLQILSDMRLQCFPPSVYFVLSFS